MRLFPQTSHSVTCRFEIIVARFSFLQWGHMSMSMPPHRGQYSRSWSSLAANLHLGLVHIWYNVASFIESHYSANPARGEA